MQCKGKTLNGGKNSCLAFQKDNGCAKCVHLKLDQMK